jgi:tripartite-type tricarboxylate transporter receptor subunit TctC
MAEASHSSKLHGNGGRRRFIAGAGAALGGAALGLAAGTPSPAQAADWPTQPIHLYIGYPPGGGTDSVARLVSNQLGKTLGTPVIIENRPGASSTIATMQVVRAQPDGYSLLFTTAAPLVGAPLTIKGLEYDPMKDLEPVTLIANGPFIMVANTKFPPNTLPELVEYARQHPGEVNYASPGSGTADYFFAELLNLDADIKTTHVPYKGSSNLISDLIGGYVQYTLDTPGTTLPLIRAGKIKPIAVFNETRLKIAPDIPTTVEAGYPNLVGGSWYGIMAPARTPKAIIDKVQQAMMETLANPDVRRGLEARDVIIRGTTPEAFRAFIKADYDKWKNVTERLGIKPE